MRGRRARGVYTSNTLTDLSYFPLETLRHLPYHAYLLKNSPCIGFLDLYYYSYSTRYTLVLPARTIDIPFSAKDRHQTPYCAT